jgi:hypothetical protein
MFRDKTTFVIGAGASAEFGMPVGTELAQLIRQSAVLRNLSSRDPLVGDDTFHETVTRLWRGSGAGSEVLQAAKRINEGIHTAVSIDAFIDRNDGNKLLERVGKMLIGLEISKAEAQSSLSDTHWPQFLHYPQYAPTNTYGKKLRNPDDTWIGHFFRILCDGVRDPAELGKNITIICFNYDRCIEHYLQMQIAAAYGLTVAAADEVVAGMTIIHPYGTLGDLPPMPYALGKGILPFGPTRDQYYDLDSIAQNIRTYTEQQHEPAMIGEIHDAIEECRVLTFLGFGFNNQNLDLLRAAHRDRSGLLQPRQIYSSGYGIAKQVDRTIKRRIMHLLWKKVEDHDDLRENVHVEFGQSCTELFQTHNLNFSKFKRSYFEELFRGDNDARVIRFDGKEEDGD